MLLNKLFLNYHQTK